MKPALPILGILLMTWGVAQGFWGVRDLPKGPLQPATSMGQSSAMDQTGTLNPADSKPMGEIGPIPVGELHFRTMINDTSQNIPEACLLFSAALNGTSQIPYQDYVAIEPPVKTGLRVDGARLCLSGFAFGSTYQLTLKQGLPGGNGEKLPEDKIVPVSFTDRESSVSFGSGFILPRETNDGLPVTTVNVQTLNVSVYRVNDRLLGQMRQNLVDERQYRPYEMSELQRETGQKIWQGTMPVSGPSNEAVVSLFPLDKAIASPQPGIYLVLAMDQKKVKKTSDDEDDYYSYNDPDYAVQSVVISDLGLTSLKSEDGLTVMVRSLKSAKPLPGVSVQLIARNNEIVSTQTSDQDGKVRFGAGLMRDKSGMTPVMLMAYAGNDYNFQDLRRPVFDLSDRGVEGRAPSGPIDAFLYTERGIYRPGESVQLTGLIRDAQARAVRNVPLTVKINRPDGREYRRLALLDKGQGGGSVTLPLSGAVNRGQWEAVAYVDPEGEPVGRVRFEVQDFVPQRLGLSLGRPGPYLRPGSNVALPVDAQFLYGAPASNLAGEAWLEIEADPNPFPRLKGYHWGIEDERFPGLSQALTITKTDETGHTQVTGVLPANIASTLPLRADISIAIQEPGGRTTGEHIYVPVRTRSLSLGIHSRFDGSVAVGQNAQFDVLAVNEGGESQSAILQYQVLKDRSTWQWYRSGKSWKYERITREEEIASGTVNADGQNPALVTLPNVGWGNYRLIVRHGESGAASSVRFWGGWYGTPSAERPDRLKLAADREQYRVGETARLHVESDTGGEALVVIANEMIHSTRTVTIPPGGGDVMVPVSGEWGPGAYALVTLYRPITGPLGHAPVRSVGVAWLGLDSRQRTLSVTIQTPEKITPRQTLQVPVRIAGGQNAFVTLAAVDQGILQLTRYKTPSPQGHYFAQRRLGLGLRDDYGRLIRGLNGSGDDQGGDAFGGKGLDVVPTRSVALFSGVVPVGADGLASIPLEIPDFQGELRLMAIAFDGDKVGSGEQKMVVRDGLVADAILPRFLAPGDQSRATVLLHDVDGGGGTYQLRLKGEAVLDGMQDQRTITLQPGQRQVFTIPLHADRAGIGRLVMQVDGPNGFTVQRDWSIQSRPAQVAETRQMVDVLPPGQSLEVNGQLLADLLPGSGSVAVTLSRWQGLDVPGLLRSLDTYPFGCVEQTASRALPLLYFKDVALLAGQADDPGIPFRVQDAIDRVLALQRPEGDFSMWRPWGHQADEWLSVYVLDFLLQARQAGYAVPDSALDGGRKWLKKELVERYASREDRIYAEYLLTQMGAGNLGDLRYSHDSAPPKEAVAWAQLASALESLGDRARAASAFDRARQTISHMVALDRKIKALPETLSEKQQKERDALREELGEATSSSGTIVSDAYAVAALLAKNGRAAQIPALLTEVRFYDTRLDRISTLTKARMLLMAAELGRHAGRVAVERDGQSLAAGDPLFVPVSQAELQAGVRFTNRGEGDIYRTLSVQGIAQAPLPPENSGVVLRKTLYSLDGKAVDPATIRRNDRLVVMIEGRAEDQVYGEYGLLDLLPAGMEIEGVLRPDQPGFAWVGPLNDALGRQPQDDRFVAAFHLPQRQSYEDEESEKPAPQISKDRWAIRMAYVVRAVTPGQFSLPAARIEHMATPYVRARTGMDQVTIAE